MTVDDICMDVTWNGWKATFSEEMPGWKELQKKVSEIFPDVTADWERKIMRTPFATTYTVLYEREDRKMPAAANFQAWFENIDRLTVQELLEERGWKSRKESEICTELINSWSDWWLEEEGYGLRLHGMVASHPDNVIILDELFGRLGATYKYAFYDGQNQLILQKGKTRQL
jgi:hypothetical protein